MDITFSAEEQDFRKEARDWLRSNVPSEPRPHHGKAMVEFDRAWQRRQFDAGWAGVAWPKEFGGCGLSLLQQLIWLEEYASAGAPAVGCYYVAINHGGPTLIALGSEEQKAFYLPKILSGETIWCQGFSEPDAGSDLASLRMKAEIDGDHLVVNGQKIWTTYAQHARYQELLVRTDSSSSKKHHGITWVICDMESPGIDVRPIKCMDGTEHFCEVFYNDVRIPLKNIVGDINDGWRVTMTTLSFERGTGLHYDQIELSNYVEQLLALSRNKVLSGGMGRAIDDGELIAKLGSLKAEVTALRAMSYKTISMARRGNSGPEATMVALYTVETMQKAFRLGMELQGSDALLLPGHPDSMQFKYLNSFIHTIGGGTSEIRRNIIGERSLGLPR